MPGGDFMLTGSCLCGRITYEIHGPLRSPRFCHCANCRQFSGTAYAAWGLVPTESFKIAGSRSHVTKYDSGGGLRVFCSSCGSPLWYEPAGLPQYRGIPLGIIDEGLVPTPEMHVWMKSKASWVTVSDDLPQHETHP